MAQPERRTLCDFVMPDISGYMGEETTMAKAKGVLELDTIKMLNAKVDALTKLVSNSQIN